MSYSMCRFWAYDESKKILGAGKDAPAWKLAAAGSMGASLSLGAHLRDAALTNGFVLINYQLVVSLALLVTPEVGHFMSSSTAADSASEIVMVRLQGDFAKPPEKRFNYKNCFDALYRVCLLSSFCLLHVVCGVASCS